VYQVNYYCVIVLAIIQYNINYKKVGGDNLNKKLKKGLTISTAAMAMGVAVPVVTVMAAPVTANGWVQADGKWYYYVNGVKLVNAWAQDSHGWCFLGADGTAIQEGWAKDSIGWCYIRNYSWVNHATWAKDSAGWQFIGTNGYWDATVAAKATNPIDDATAAVVKAEASKAADDVAAAEDAIAAIKGATPETAALTARVDAIDTTFQVVSVKAINPIKIQVVFSEPVDKDTATDKANYKLNNVTLNGDYTLTLEDDDKTVTIDIAPAAKLENGSAYALKVTDNVLSATDEEVEAKTVSFLFNDKAAPELLKVEATAADTTKTVKVTFDEPVAGNGIYKVNGKSATVDPLTKGTDKLTLNVDKELEAGVTYTLTVYGESDISTDANDIEDTISKTFKVVSDTTAPSITSIKQTGAKEITVKFSEELGATLNGKFTLMKGVTPIGATAALDADDDDNLTWIVTITGDPYGDKDTVSLNFFIAEAAIEDLYGNETEDDISKTVSMTKDEDGPSVESVKATTDREEFKITFGENVQNLTTSKILITDADGIKHNVTGGYIIDKDVFITITAAGTKIPVDTYTLKINEGFVKDTVGNDNVATTKKVTVTAAADTDRPTAVVADLTGNKFQVTYSEEMTDSALIASNYLLDGVALPSDADIYFVDDNKTVVNIVLQDGSVDYSKTVQLYVRGAVDVAGNKVVPVGGNVAVADNTKPELESAQVIGDTIVLHFSEDIKAATLGANLADILDDLQIKCGTTTVVADAGVATASLVTGDASKVSIVFTTVAATGWDSAKTITIKTLENTDITDNTNNKVVDGTTVTATK